MELNRLPDSYYVGDRNASRVVIRADDVADQKITALKILSIFVDHPAEEEPRLHQSLVVLIKPGVNLFELFESRNTGKF